ncbi:MAG TPA: biotin/lipoyl-containing protein, partial [Pyrinomonadaceae bacterium]
MSTEVVMPQMGESIAEGTITKWLKKLGERVERDEPLFEISTDKVDAEIPSPAAGTLTEIRFNEGDTVEVNTVVAVLDGAGDGASSSATAGAAAASGAAAGAGAGAGADAAAGPAAGAAGSSAAQSVKSPSSQPSAVEPPAPPV